MMGKNLKEQRK
jgi:hypothetical protein